MAEASQAYRHDTLCQGEEMLCRLASLRALTVPPLSNRGVLLQKQKSKHIQKPRYETMYEVIRTYCTSHPVISTRQVENSISEAQNTRCMLLWAYAFLIGVLQIKVNRFP